MKCLILAAGYATRLYPLTSNFPKPLLKVKDKAILDWLIDDIAKTGKVNEYVVVSNHKFIDHFMKWKDTRSENITIIDDGTVDNENRLGAVCDIELAINKLNIDEELMVIAGDNLLDFSLSSFIDYFYEKGNTAIMRYYTEDENRLKKSANILIDEDNTVIEMIEKPEKPISNWCVPAFYIYARDDVKLVSRALNEGCAKDAPGSYICWLHKKSIVRAMQMPGKRYDIGTLETYNLVNEEYNGIK